MKKLVFILGLAVLLGACNLKESQISSDSESVEDNKVTSISSKTIALAEQLESQQSGKVMLTDLGGGQTKVEIVLDGKLSSKAQPAHIHRGSCPIPGIISYPLTDVIGGTSSTVITASIGSLFDSEAMAINVHKSIEEPSIYVSCGDLN